MSDREFGETRRSSGLFSSILGKKDNSDPFAQPANVVGLGATNFDFLAPKADGTAPTNDLTKDIVPVSTAASTTTSLPIAASPSSPSPVSPRRSSLFSLLSGGGSVKKTPGGLSPLPENSSLAASSPASPRSTPSSSSSAPIMTAAAKSSKKKPKDDSDDDDFDLDLDLDLDLDSPANTAATTVPTPLPMTPLVTTTNTAASSTAAPTTTTAASSSSSANMVYRDGQLVMQRKSDSPTLTSASISTVSTSSSNSSTASSSPSSSSNDNLVVAKPGAVVGSWVCTADPKTGRIYFWNRVSGVVTWDIPSGYISQADAKLRTPQPPKKEKKPSSPDTMDLGLDDHDNGDDDDDDDDLTLDDDPFDAPGAPLSPTVAVITTPANVTPTPSTTPGTNGPSSGRFVAAAAKVGAMRNIANAFDSSSSTTSSTSSSVGSGSESTVAKPKVGFPQRSASVSSPAGASRATAISFTHSMASSTTIGAVATTSFSSSSSLSSSSVASSSSSSSSSTTNSSTASATTTSTTSDVTPPTTPTPVKRASIIFGSTASSTAGSTSTPVTPTSTGGLGGQSGSLAKRSSLIFGQPAAGISVVAANANTNAASSSSTAGVTDSSTLPPTPPTPNNVKRLSISAAFQAQIAANAAASAPPRPSTPSTPATPGGSGNGAATTGNATTPNGGTVARGRASIIAGMFGAPPPSPSPAKTAAASPVIEQRRMSMPAQSIASRTKMLAGVFGAPPSPSPVPTIAESPKPGVKPAKKWGTVSTDPNNPTPSTPLASSSSNDSLADQQPAAVDGASMTVSVTPSTPSSSTTSPHMGATSSAPGTPGSSAATPNAAPGRLNLSAFLPSTPTSNTPSPQIPASPGGGGTPSDRRGSLNVAKGHAMLAGLFGAPPPSSPSPAKTPSDRRASMFAGSMSGRGPSPSPSPSNALAERAAALSKILAFAPAPAPAKTPNNSNVKPAKKWGTTPSSSSAADPFANLAMPEIPGSGGFADLPIPEMPGGDSSSAGSIPEPPSMDDSSIPTAPPPLSLSSSSSSSSSTSSSIPSAPTLARQSSAPPLTPKQPELPSTITSYTPSSAAGSRHNDDAGWDDDDDASKKSTSGSSSSSSASSGGFNVAAGRAMLAGMFGTPKSSTAPLPSPKDSVASPRSNGSSSIKERSKALGQILSFAQHNPKPKQSQVKPAKKWATVDVSSAATPTPAASPFDDLPMPEMPTSSTADLYGDLPMPEMPTAGDSGSGVPDAPSLDRSMSTSSVTTSIPIAPLMDDDDHTPAATPTPVSTKAAISASSSSSSLSSKKPSPVVTPSTSAQPSPTLSSMPSSASTAIPDEPMEPLDRADAFLLKIRARKDAEIAAAKAAAAAAGVPYIPPVTGAPPTTRSRSNSPIPAESSSSSSLSSVSTKKSPSTDTDAKSSVDPSPRSSPQASPKAVKISASNKDNDDDLSYKDDDDNTSDSKREKSSSHDSSSGSGNVITSSTKKKVSVFAEVELSEDATERLRRQRESADRLSKGSGPSRAAKKAAAEAAKAEAVKAAAAAKARSASRARAKAAGSSSSSSAGSASTSNKGSKKETLSREELAERAADRLKTFKTQFKRQLAAQAVSDPKRLGINMFLHLVTRSLDISDDHAADHIYKWRMKLVDVVDKANLLTLVRDDETWPAITLPDVVKNKIEELLFPVPGSQAAELMRTMARAPPLLTASQSVKKLPSQSSTAANMGQASAATQPVFSSIRTQSSSSSVKKMPYTTFSVKKSSSSSSSSSAPPSSSLPLSATSPISTTAGSGIPQRSGTQHTRSVADRTTTSTIAKGRDRVTSPTSGTNNGNVSPSLSSLAGRPAFNLINVQKDLPLTPPRIFDLLTNSLNIIPPAQSTANATPTLTTTGGITTKQSGYGMRRAVRSTEQLSRSMGAFGLMATPIMMPQPSRSTSTTHVPDSKTNDSPINSISDEKRQRREAREAARHVEWNGATEQQKWQIILRRRRRLAEIRSQVDVQRKSRELQAIDAEKSIRAIEDEKLRDMTADYHQWEKRLQTDIDAHLLDVAA